MTRIVAALLALALLAAGCGDGGDEVAAPQDPVEQPAEQPAEAPTAVPTETPTEEPAAPPQPTPSPPKPTPTAAPTATPTATPTTQPTATPSPDDDHIGINVTWNDPSVVVKLTDGWTIGACRGEAPMLCLSRRGEHRAAIEATSFPVSSFSYIDPDAGVHEILQAIQKNFMKRMVEDRAIGCGEGYEVTPRGYEKRTVGRMKGAKFGFDGTSANGKASEADIHYVTVVDGQIVMIVASAFNPNGCLAPEEAGSLTTDQLAKLEPYLDEIIANSKLPRSVL